MFPFLPKSVEKKRDKNETRSYIPLLFSLSNLSHQKRLSAVLKESVLWSVRDCYIDQMRELFFVSNPHLIQDNRRESLFRSYMQKQKTLGPLWQQGQWVWYPWKKTLVHVLDRISFCKVRSSRNFPLVSEEEQKEMEKGKIGIAGLSVGSHIAYSLLAQGSGSMFHLSDGDKLSLSNLNRIPGGVTDLGTAKTVIAARRMYEANPYIRVRIFPHLSSQREVGRFCKNLSVIIDEIDDMKIKYLLRREAVRFRIPIISAVDIGDRCVVFIERYDIQPNLSPFAGFLGSRLSARTFNSLTKKEIGSLILRLVGEENITAPLRESLSAVGNSIVSWPQLGSTAYTNGGVVAFCVRSLLTGGNVRCGRVTLPLDSLFLETK